MNFRWGKSAGMCAVVVVVMVAAYAGAQELGPGFTKVMDGIYLFAAKDGNSTCSVVLTQEGPVVIDTCQRPPDTHHLMAGIKKLTDKRFAL